MERTIDVFDEAMNEIKGHIIDLLTSSWDNYEDFDKFVAIGAELDNLRCMFQTCYNERDTYRRWFHEKTKEAIGLKEKLKNLEEIINTKES